MRGIPKGRIVTAKERYDRKIAAGVCTWGTCGQPLSSASHCATHEAIHQKYNRAWWSSEHPEHLRRKAAGLCINRRCENQASEQALLCQQHRERHMAASKAYRATPKAKAAHSKQAMACRARMIAAGRCPRCCKKWDGMQRFCDVCRDKINTERRHGRPCTSKCGACRDIGHTIGSCKLVREAMKTIRDRQQAVWLVRKKIRQAKRERNESLKQRTNHATY